MHRYRTIAMMSAATALLVVVTTLPAAAHHIRTAPAAATAGKASCEGSAHGLAGFDWQYGKANTSVAGHPGYMKFYDLLLEANTIMLAEVKGFNEQGQAVWAPVPAMDYQSPRRQIKVTWGNSLATPEIRVKPAFAQTGGKVSFTC
ncbi:hypothetical protein [Streptomyces sp. NPDC048442]|uniref:hypothetical protein n=1 Tax=Streptomyces sp. NPDC048442 TaxID=3154823 RepID=UPI0034436D38